jgi:hypothetical protein
VWRDLSDPLPEKMADRLDVSCNGINWYSFNRAIASYVMQHDFWEVALEADVAPPKPYPQETPANKTLKGLISGHVQPQYQDDMLWLHLSDGWFLLKGTAKRDRMLARPSHTLTHHARFS